MNAIEYYNSNAQLYFLKTKDADMRQIYSRFLPYLTPNALICDLGCGSGRDSKFFMEKGYSVFPIDGSQEMCRLASHYLSINVVCQLFDEFYYNDKFDAMWACSSLLHENRENMYSILERIIQSCKNNGVIYICFKHGLDESESNGLFYTNYTKESLCELLQEFHSVKLEDIWLSYDVRNLQDVPQWLNAILRVEK